MKKTLNPRYVDILIPEDIMEDDAPNFPLKPEHIEGASFVKITVDIKTAKVINWTDECGYYELFCKPVDSGIYIIRAEDGKELDRIEEDYVPNKLVPGEWGDYIEMTISKSGYVTNWHNKPSLKEFRLDFSEIERIFEED